MHRLRGADCQFPGVLLENFLDHLGLGDIVDTRSCPVRVDVIDLVGFNSRFLKRHTDGAYRAAHRGLGDV